jgi:hypothetical protein
MSARPADLHVVIALSGGVDSSVAALELVRAGYRVSALFMKNWNEPAEDGRCRWEDDVADALEVCEKLDIPLNTVDLSQAYWDGVFADFLAEYSRGRTPNPDVLCNREIKFDVFLDAARVVEHKAVRFVGMQAEPSTYHLRIQRLGERWPKQDHAVNPFGVEPFGEHVHVQQVVVRTVFEPVSVSLARRGRRFSRNRGRVDRVLTQLVAHVRAVLDIYTKPDAGSACLAANVAHRGPDRPRYDVVRIHNGGQAVRDVIAAAVAFDV